jgi:hypothetical protein
MYKFFITILLVFSSLIPSFTFAADDGDFWLQRQIIEGDGKNAYGKKIYGKAARAVMEDIPLANGTGSSVEQMIKRSIAADKPTPTKVGSSMLKRIYSPQAIVGTAAVTGLLAAIGWVMEDGIYVKKIPDDSDEPDPDYQYKSSRTGNLYDTAAQLGKADFSKIFSSSWVYHTVWLDGNLVTVQGKNTSTARLDQYQVGTRVPRIVPVEPPKTKTVPLTAALLGAAMLGSQYTDPDPKFDNDIVNTDVYTGVADTYEHDPSGVGNELADAMDDKLKNAKPTDDGKSSYIGDPKYDHRLLGDDRDDSSDRGWDEKGDEATGGTEPTKDPETGEATGGQSISLQFPLFCSWASKMCLWYDDWKSSDKVHQKFEEDVKNHQKDEKSFWQTVKDWFDWSKKDDDLPERDETDLITELPIEQKTKNINWSAQCPTAQSVPINFHGVTAEITVADFSYLCSLDWLIKPFVLAFASISAAFIVFGFNRGGDDG